MDVLLKETIENLGRKDEIVKVKNGYGRNFLIPTGKAVLATDSIKKMNAETLKQRAHKVAKEKSDAQTIADKLQKASIKVGAKVGENEKIFGSVTTVQIADALKAQGFTVDRKSIKLKSDTIKTIGTYEAEVDLFKDVKVSINFEVVAE